jgi:DNA-binding response OmpR family regulator
VETARVLLVDDDPSILALLESTFGGDRRFEIYTALTGDQALHISREVQPHLVLLDVMLPGRDGYSACRLIKNDERCAGTQVVLLSALDQQAEGDTWKKVGADDFLIKPIRPSELLSAVERRLKMTSTG